MKIFHSSLQWSIVFFLLIFCSGTNASEEQERLVRNGLKMFRTILTADQDINSKHNKIDGIDIVFLYKEDLTRARGLARKFVLMGRGDKKGKIKDHPIKVHITTDITNIENQKINAAGIFILDPLSEEILQSAADYGLQNKIVTYSPFQGDVEKGILGGLIIDTRPKPYINVDTLDKSGLRIKSFFLRVAKLYESGS